MSKTELVKAVTNSENRKLGKASTTYATQASCPSDCVFMNAGCYAERGYVGITVRNLNKHAVTISATKLVVAQAEAGAIDAMEVVVGKPLRLHTVGDCATNMAARLVSAATARYTKRGGGRAWSYTHAWKKVSRKSWGDVSILASCETAEDVREAKSRGYATAIVVDEFKSDKLYEVDGMKILPCPAQTHEDVVCTKCRLCFDDEGIRTRDYSIGFAVHGDHVTKKRAREAVSAVK